MELRMSEHLLQKIAAAIALGLLCLVGASLANGAPAGYPPPAPSLRGGVPGLRGAGTHRRWVGGWRMPGTGRVGNRGSSSPAVAPRATGLHTLFQTSTINALLDGVYDGDLPVATLRQHGDFGLGTLNGLDGELVQVDGQVFQVRSDGTARRVPDDARVPFANTTFFHADRSVTVEKPLSFQQMTAYLDTLLRSCNIFHAIRIEGTFAYVRTRSVPRQAKPYPRLAEVVKTQPTFEFRNQRGVMVGFWTPDYAASLNAPGYHFHFLTADRTGGGHVLDCTLGQVKISVEDIPRLFLDLPRTREFQAAVLATESRRELNKVEK
jgi:acetolactate decarboxylase